MDDQPAGQKRKPLGVIDGNARQTRSRSGQGVIKPSQAKPAPSEEKAAESSGGGATAGRAKAAQDTTNSWRVEAVQVQGGSLEARAGSSMAGAGSAMDIDSGDREDEQACTEYCDEIYAFLRQDEVRSMVRADYMQQQTDINCKMRVILTDWLVEVHLKFKLRQETLYLTFQLIDRFLQANVVARQRLQLVGVTALMIAAKYEEIYPPEVRDYVYICDNAYTGEQIVQMEQLILCKLSFRLTVPTPRSFLKRFCKAAQGDSRLLLLVSFLLELALVDFACLKFRPSLLCAAATSLALSISGRPAWSPTLAKHSRYVAADLEGCVAHLAGLHAKAGAGAQKAVHKKYSSSRFHSVAALPTPTNREDDDDDNEEEEEEEEEAEEE
eukprot:CAMPEP_0202816898 /NCGR_PEP_ID=MMETSP1389-20130828/7256_1 /ASSEMBLY_ACC=CAM_ASM_000865 /TAXON_ID=302021 /ORGANISM="Rhodomonas sp., Strain CCMP768" /LENGTH=382 /DNA_ID=CAMNT_0049489023 /DNA_START=81 /DNA_END=1227 /DNA_ORIENTATION=-